MHILRWGFRSQKFQAGAPHPKQRGGTRWQAECGNLLSKSVVSTGCKPCPGSGLLLVMVLGAGC